MLEQAGGRLHALCYALGDEERRASSLHGSAAETKTGGRTAKPTRVGRARAGRSAGLQSNDDLRTPFRRVAVFERGRMTVRGERLPKWLASLRVVTIAVHTKKEAGAGLLNRILKDATIG
jgi:hypothetical protein